MVHSEGNINQQKLFWGTSWGQAYRTETPTPLPWDTIKINRKYGVEAKTILDLKRTITKMKKKSLEGFKSRSEQRT